MRQIAIRQQQSGAQEFRGFIRVAQFQFRQTPDSGLPTRTGILPGCGRFEAAGDICVSEDETGQIGMA